MALRQALFPSLFPNLHVSSTPTLQSRIARFAQQLAQPLFGSALAVPISISLNIPPILPGLWESILRAVPKKKTSHRKKRQRFMAGKGLKDVTALNKCSACGKVKRAHLLCPYCVAGRSKSTIEVLIEVLNRCIRDQEYVEGKRVTN